MKYSYQVITKYIGGKVDDEFINYETSDLSEAKAALELEQRSNLDEKYTVEGRAYKLPDEREMDELSEEEQQSVYDDGYTLFTIDEDDDHE